MRIKKLQGIGGLVRARNLKPGIYKNFELAKLGDSAFRLFTGLWAMADRMGRLKDEPEKIQAELFPFRFQVVDVEALLHDLCTQEDPFLIRYEVKGQKYIQVVNFSDHQRPHPKEIESTIPPWRKKLSPRFNLENTQDTPNPSGSSDVQGLQDLPIPDIALSRSLAPEMPVERREYRIPEPKDDPTAALVMYYKAVKKGIPYDDRDWDKTHWARSAKAASAVLKTCGSYEAARACVDHVSESMGEKSWTLETIVRWAHEWKAKQGGKDYGTTNSARFFGAVAKQRTASKFTELRAVSTSGQILDGIRDHQRLSYPAGETGRGAAGGPDGDAVAGVPENAMEAEADRGITS